MRIIMPSVLDKKDIYRDGRDTIGLNKRQYGRIFALGQVNNSDQVVGHKENPIKPSTGNTSKGVNKAEALAAQLLVLLHEEGYLLKEMTFDEQGRILSAPKKVM
jgi:hypothetical protein